MMLRFSVITYTFGRLTTKKHNKVMKKLIFLFAFCIVVTNVFAQTAPEQLKKEGNDALNAKNYQVAFTKYDAYLKQTNNSDSVMAYNCGVCADQIKKYADAVKYFDVAIQKNYNEKNLFMYILYR